MTHNKALIASLLTLPVMFTIIIHGWHVQQVKQIEREIQQLRIDMENIQQKECIIHVNTDNVVDKESQEVSQGPYHDTIYAVAKEYGVDGTTMSNIIFCESGYDPYARNNSSSAQGLAQFIDSTWALTPQGKKGQNRLDPVTSITAMAWLIKTQGTHHWNASRHCWDT